MKKTGLFIIIILSFFVGSAIAADCPMMKLGKKDSVAESDKKDSTTASDKKGAMMKSGKIGCPKMKMESGKKDPMGKMGCQDPILTRHKSSIFRRG